MPLLGFLGPVAKFFLPSIGKKVAKAILPKALELIPGKVGDIAEEVLGDVWGDPQQNADLKAQREKYKLKLINKVQSSMAEIAIAETTKGNWIQKSWRPIAMLTFVILISLNALLPIWNEYMATTISLNIPEGMWSLLTIGMTTYIGARTIEKIGK